MPSSSSSSSCGCEVVSIAVISGATQTNVTGLKNWAAVKDCGSPCKTCEPYSSSSSSSSGCVPGDVIVEVTLDPNTDEAAQHLTWTGGSAVPGKPRRRKVSKATSAKTTVKASCCGTSAELDVWILWGTVTIKMTGTTPPNAVQFGSLYDGTENLGAISYDGGTIAVGKVVPIAQLTPAGVHDVVKDGWAFKRCYWAHEFKDGVQAGPHNTTTWVDDSSDSSFQNLVPDGDDKIYDRDAPNIAAFGSTNCTEKYLNFYQFIQWNGKVASQCADWSWKGKWFASGMPEEVIVKEVSGSHITLPATAAGCP